MEEITTQVCCRCGEAKPKTTEFFGFRKARGQFATHCKSCAAASTRAYRAANPERVALSIQESRERNREKEYERSRRNRLANPEAQREAVKKSYYKNQAKRLESRRAYRIANLEKEKEYDRLWKDKFPERYARKGVAKAQKRGEDRAKAAGVQIEIVDYFAILERDGKHCHICNTEITQGWLSFDHVIPLSKGGPHTFGNVAVAHYECNRRKNNTTD